MYELIRWVVLEVIPVRDNQLSSALKTITPIRKVSDTPRNDCFHILGWESTHQVSLDRAVVLVHASLITAEPLKGLAHFLSGLVTD